MKGYLGEFDIDIKDTKYKDFTSKDWALEYIFSYGQIDGDHHKQWVLDQVNRILNDTPIILKEARWDNGKTELRFNTGEPSQKYLDWVENYKVDEEGEEYYYDEGICP